MRILSLAAALSLLPLAATAVTADLIRSCDADRRGAGCATLHSRLFVCMQAPEIEGCADLLALRDAALGEDDAAEAADRVDEQAEPEVTPRAEGELGAEAEALAECPVLASGDWAAQVGAVDGHEGRQLVLTGEVTLPTPAWTVELILGRADRSAIPVQTVRLQAEPPDAPTTQELTVYPLRLVTPSIGAVPPEMTPYRGVIVTCEADVLIELTDIGLLD